LLYAFIECHVAVGARGTRPRVILAVSIKERRFNVHGGYWSQDGGAESQFHYRRDALQLAAHELGGRRAKSSPPGVYVVTAAGKEYFSRLRPFQQSPITEWQDTAEAITTLKQDIEFRMMEIYEQLLKWPKSPLVPLPGDRSVNHLAMSMYWQ
jgi:hypothetical protein